MKEKLKYAPLALKLLFLAIISAIIYRDRDNLYRFCRYPFPFIMCPICDYPCFFQTYRLQLKTGIGVAVTGLVGGRLFCGVVCPVGTIQDWLSSLRRLALSLLHSLKRLFFPPNASAPKHTTVNRRRLHKALGRVWWLVSKGWWVLDRGLRLLKYPLLLVVFAYSLVRFLMFFDLMPDWGFIPALQFTMEVRRRAGRGFEDLWFAFLVTSFGAGIILHRPWCKYLCPFGLLFAFLNKISFLRIKLEEQDDERWPKCLKNCTTGKPIDKLEKGFASVECVRCYDCVLSCPKGAVKVKSRTSK